jgi:predicted ATP-dependent endonuclease of OLD family
VFVDEADTTRFVTRYLKVTHCDLFFADAAVLIEGPAERILVPHFVRWHTDFYELSECYVTWLEITGSHAHKLRDLIESLGLTTLIITDLDAMDQEGKSVTPERNASQTSRNETLKTWCPATDNLDELLKKTDSDKVKTYKEQRFSIRVAYQHSVKITFKGVEADALANTLEDALVFQNIDLFASLNGRGLITKFKKAIEESSTTHELGKALFECLKGGGKAELALDLLEIRDPKSLRPPDYIREGLTWLTGQLRQRQIQLGLPVTATEEKAAA